MFSGLESIWGNLCRVQFLPQILVYGFASPLDSLSYYTLLYNAFKPIKQGSASSHAVEYDCT